MRPARSPPRSGTTATTSASSELTRPTWPAVNRLGEIEGGFAVAEGGKVVAELLLAVGGLMSLTSFEDVREGLIPLRKAAPSASA